MTLSFGWFDNSFGEEGRRAKEWLLSMLYTIEVFCMSIV